MIQTVSAMSIPRVSLRTVLNYPMVTQKAERLRAAREKAGYDSAADAARAFGWKEPAYRHHENGTRGFGPDAAKRYGRAFKVKPGWLLGLDNVSGAPAPDHKEDDRLVVNGSVEAGVWRASEYWDDERTFVIEGMPSPFPNIRRFGMVVAGKSMDKHYQPGEVLDCISAIDSGAKPQTGDHVIVENVRSDGLRELTVKEYREEAGRYWLVPCSSDPKFTPVEYDGPDAEHTDQSEIRVIAFVITSYPERTLTLMRRMGMIKPA